MELVKLKSVEFFFDIDRGKIYNVNKNGNRGSFFSNLRTLFISNPGWLTQLGVVDRYIIMKTAKNMNILPEGFSFNLSSEIGELDMNEENIMNQEMDAEDAYQQQMEAKRKEEEGTEDDYENPFEF